VMIHTGIITTLAYLVLAPIGGALKPAPELVEAVHAVPPPSAPAAVGGTPLSGFERILLYASGLVALVSLAPWVGASVVVTPEVLDASREQVSSFRQVLTYAQPAFFVAMIVWLYLWEKSRAWSRLVYTLSLLVAVASLVLSLAFAWAVFQGWMPLARFKEHLPLLTLVYFIAGVLWMRHREKRPSRG
ncbi:MAG: hypothetical protein NUV77_13225, partial [Thermoguttaceae bacterium]|nr:hypothetical protein [Thermoguttaceae bacterium]